MVEDVAEKWRTGTLQRRGFRGRLGHVRGLGYRRGQGRSGGLTHRGRQELSVIFFNFNDMFLDYKVKPLEPSGFFKDPGILMNRQWFRTVLVV